MSFTPHPAQESAQQEHKEPDHKGQDHKGNDASLSQLEGGLHEVYAATQADAACLSAAALMLVQARGQPSRLLWIREAGQQRELGPLSPGGLVELGVDPARIVMVFVRDPVAALQAALEGARCTASLAVIIELFGRVPSYDLTASRRLALAARESGRVVLVVRTAASPTPSAAHTRWQVRAMPSRALAARAPGPPALELLLLRARNGLEGLRYCVEWDRDARQFIPRSFPVSDDAVASFAPLSGAVVPLSSDRPGLAQGWRQAG